MSRFIWQALYYGLARHLPPSFGPLIGRLSKRMRGALCRRLFRRCGHDVNVESGASFGGGRSIELGDRSGIGVDCTLLGPVAIGAHVMMGPQVYIVRVNHRIDDLDRPMMDQGMAPPVPLVIGDDVWIGGRAIILTGCRRIGRGAVVGAGAVVTRDVADYAVVGGNPARVLKMRLPVPAASGSCPSDVVGTACER